MSYRKAPGLFTKKTMNPENLKQILEVLNHATDQAKQAFYVYLSFSLAETIIVTGSIVGLLVYIAKLIYRGICHGDELLNFYNEVRLRAGLRRSEFYGFEAQELLEKIPDQRERKNK